MTGDSRLRAVTVHHLDQSIAAYTQWLTEAAASYRYLVDNGEGDLVTVGGMATWFADDFDPDLVCDLLAVAVRMLGQRR